MSAQPISIAQHFHERTKYDPQTIAARSQGLNWDNQPVPFKDYKLGTTLDLKLYLTGESIAEPLDSVNIWRQRLSHLLFCSYGLTAKVPTLMSDPVYLRAAPSAGGLYPAEVYLISKGTPYLDPGLYNYQAKTHSLLHFWNSEVWASLQNICFEHPVLETATVVVVTTAVFFRSIWRYQDRAYRRIFLDTGHLLGNIELASAISQFRPYLIGGFKDEAANQLLYLDPQQEGVTAIIPLLDLLDTQPQMPSFETALPSTTQTTYPEIADGELFKYLHQATQISADLSPTWTAVKTEPTRADKYNIPFCLKVSTAISPMQWDVGLHSLETTLLHRRSTRSYNGAGLVLDELKALLDFTYQPQHYQDQGLDHEPDYFDLNLIETFIAVSSVSGLDDGCYYFAPKAQELRQIRFKNFRADLHRLCLGQELGRDASAVVFHTADLKAAIAQYGDRAYRYLHLDAGHLGQRMNVAAIRLGLGVSGIAGFFDDQVNEVLGIPIDEAVLYITTLGRPQ
jgi:SagB-type dehydrogenase family enzyme